MNDRADSRTEGEIGPAEAAELIELLAFLAAHEARIAARLYPHFFERRPDAHPLFGVHAIAEREEMIRETFRSLLALAEGEPWLAANLEALGRSHFEYGVTGDMYGDFVDVFVEVAADGLDSARRGVLRRGLTRISDALRRAGDRAAPERHLSTAAKATAPELPSPSATPRT